MKTQSGKVMADEECQNLDSDQKDMLMAVHENFRHQMSQLRHDGTFADLLVTCNATDGEKVAFRVHKLVMCCNSQYFYDLLQDDTTPFNQLELPPVNSKVLEVLIDFMYSGDLQLGRLPHSELKTVPLVAQNLGIYSVGNVFINSLCKIVTIDSLPALMELQSKLQSKELERAMQRFILANISQLNGEIICLLTPNDLKIYLAKSSHLGTPPDVLLQGALEWVGHNPVVRTKLLPSILADIKIEALPEDFVNYIMEDQVIMQQYPALKDRLIAAKRAVLTRSSPVKEVIRPQRNGTTRTSSSHRSTRQQTQTSPVPDGSTSPTTGTTGDSPSAKVMAKTIFTPIKAANDASRRPPSRERHFKGPGFVLIGRDEANRASIMFRSLAENDWSQIEDLGLSLEYKQGLAFSEDCAFFIGGEDMHGEKMIQCFMRDLVTNETRKLPQLQIKRASPVIAVHHRMIYAIGGIGRFGTALSHVECLDGVFAASWQNAPPLRVKRSDETSCCIYRDLIYVIGGGTNKCECYDRKRQSWQEVPSLPQDFNDLVPLTAVAADKLFAFNYYKPQTMYWLDTGSRSWKELHTRGVGPEWVVRAVGVNKEVFALDKSRWFFVYDVQNNSWRKSVRFPRAMAHLSYMVSVQ